MSKRVSITPSKLTVTNIPNPVGYSQLVDAYYSKKYGHKRNINSLNNLKDNSLKSSMSNSSKKRLKNACSYLHQLSKARDINLKNGKTLYNFRTCFFTLTLPSKQEHDDRVIKRECLNQLILELKKYCNMNNYVWKAELQKNSNIHFHFITDVYIDYHLLRRVWNRIINKLDYVDRYSDRFSKMDFTRYSALRRKNNEVDVKVLYRDYNNGKKSNWSNPNSVDVVKVNNSKQLNWYLAKYMGKDTDDNDRLNEFGRVWYCSRKLSKLRENRYMMLDELDDFFQLINDKKIEVLDCVYEYCRVIYYDFSKIPMKFKKMFDKIFRGLADGYNYIYPA